MLKLAGNYFLAKNEQHVDSPAQIFRIFEKRFMENEIGSILVEGGDFVPADFPVKIKAFPILIRRPGTPVL